MQYTTMYQSPIGEIFLTADKIGLTGLWFDTEKFYTDSFEKGYEKKEVPIFGAAKKWLDIYFSGQKPEFVPKMHISGSSFQLSVWKLLRQIPYGETTTYGELAKMVAKERGISRMSAQAIGGAVGHNRISIIIPCHRVIGSNGNLTGYAGGLDKKKKLLLLEGVDIEI